MKNHRPISGDGSAPVAVNPDHSPDSESGFTTPGNKARTTAVQFFHHAKTAYTEPSDSRGSLASPGILTVCAPVHISFHLIPAISTYFHLIPFISSYLGVGKSALDASGINHATNPCNGRDAFHPRLSRDCGDPIIPRLAHPHRSAYEEPPRPTPTHRALDCGCPPPLSYLFTATRSPSSKRIRNQPSRFAPLRLSRERGGEAFLSRPSADTPSVVLRIRKLVLLSLLYLQKNISPKYATHNSLHPLKP
jgi:hypothetical protein